MKFLHAVVHDLEGVQRNFEQIEAGGLFVGDGVPTFMANMGNYYFRTDTPNVANQRIYVCTGGAVWLGIV